MIPKLFLTVSILLASISIGYCDSIDVDTMTLLDLQDLAAKNAASVKTMRNQYESGKIDVKQQHFWYWAVPQVNLGFQYDADLQRITTNPNLGLNLDRFFFRGRDDRERAKINLRNISISIDKEISLIRIDVKNKYDNYMLLKQKAINLENNKKQISDILDKVSNGDKKDSTGLALIIQQQNQLVDSIYQVQLEVNQKRSDLISVVEGNR